MKKPIFSIQLNSRALIALVLASLFWAPLRTQALCIGVFESSQVAAESLLELPPEIFDPTIETLRTEVNTTSLREELKWTVSKKQAGRFLKKLDALSLGRLENRDPVQEDFTNVTVTDYLPEMTLGSTGRNVKIRFRRYGKRPNETKNTKKKSNIYYEGIFRDHIKLEIKIDHPTYENVVFKPVIFITLGDFKKIRSGQIENQFRRILFNTQFLRWNGKPVNSAALAQDVLSLLLDLHDRGISLKPVDRVMYERKAYRWKIGSPEEEFDFQFTFDERVRLYPLESAQQPAKLPKDQIVVEAKAPIQFLHLDPSEQVKIFPFFNSVRAELEKFRQVPGMKKGRGKRKNLKRKNR